MQWYAHQGTAVWCTTGGVDGTIGLGYHDKGWPSFEYRLAMMIKVANTFTFADWPQVVDLSNMAVVLPLLRSVAPQKLVSESEWHVLTDCCTTVRERYTDPRHASVRKRPSPSLPNPYKK